MSRKKYKKLIYIVAGLTILSLLGMFLVYKYMPSFKEETFHAAMGLNTNGDYFILSGEVIEDTPPLLNSGVLYIPVDFIKAHIDQYIFWDEEADRLSITTENKVIRMNTDTLNYYVNNTPMRLNLPAYKIEGNAYLPAEFVEEFYNLSIEYNSSSRLACVDFLDLPRVEAKALKNTPVRFSPDIKSPIIETLAKADKAVLLEAYDEASKFIKIRTPDGAMAYAPTKAIGELNEIPASPKPEEPPLRPSKPLEGKITLLWDQILKVSNNSRPEEQDPYPGLDVISPTWFSFDEDSMNGDIINIADKAYVDWAHENGYQVWALITDNFNRDVNHAVLSNTEIREHVIRQLLALTAMYELDGINIDFEALREADAEYYLQFLRELGPLLREQGASLSVDMFVPTYTKYYNRTEVGKVADYICVMTYDEHYSGSETSGPVASLPFVDRGISDTMEEVPSEKVIMGLPFYVRVWREVEKDGKTTHTIKNYAMETAYRIFTENGAAFTWLPDIGSHYGEYTVTEEGETVTYKVWLEDLRSIEEKLSLATRLNVAGVACWKRGLEAEGVWSAIAEWSQGE